MCRFKKKKKSSLRTTKSGTTNVQTAREHSGKKGYEIPKQVEKKHGIHDVHRKIRHHSEDCTIEEQKKEMAKAQKALGLRPNTAILERIAERDRKFEKTQEMSKVNSVMSQKGDIAFSFTKKKHAKDDDTIAPNFKVGKPAAARSPGLEKDGGAGGSGGCNTPNPEEELIEEDQVESEPNSDNYMYNCKEIVYTCHDMVRSMGKAEITDVAGELTQNDLQGNVKWDPYGNLKELESRDMFNCQILRRNTLVSNTLAMPSEAEKAKYQKHQKQKNHDAKDSTKKKKQHKVVIKLPVKDLSEFNDLSNISDTQSVSTCPKENSKKEELKEKKQQQQSPQPQQQPRAQSPLPAQQKSNPILGKSKESCKTAGPKSAEKQASGFQQQRSAFASSSAKKQAQQGS